VHRGKIIFCIGFSDEGPPAGVCSLFLFFLEGKVGRERAALAARGSAAVGFADGYGEGVEVVEELGVGWDGVGG